MGIPCFHGKACCRSLQSTDIWEYWWRLGQEREGFCDSTAFLGLTISLFEMVLQQGVQAVMLNQCRL